MIAFVHVLRTRLPRAAATVAALLIVLTLAGDGRAAGSDISRNTLPPPAPRRAIPAEGVLFHDTFSDSLDGWSADREGVWSIRRGMLRADLPDRKQERSLIYAGSENWADYAVEVDVCMMRGVDKGVLVRVNDGTGVGVDVRGPGYNDVLMHQGTRPLGRKRAVNGNARWHRLRLEARGHTYTLWLDGEKIMQRRDRRRACPYGRIALPAYTGGVARCTVYYDNLVVMKLEEAP